MTNQRVILSACLLGEPCRYDGSGKKDKALLKKLGDVEIIPVCPEVEGGLSTPRPPAEIKGSSVVREDGTDVTQAFIRGAERCTGTALEKNAELAILKSRSPACGCGQIYDGSFTGTPTTGDGIFTRSLKAAGIQCVSDEDFLSK